MRKLTPLVSLLASTALLIGCEQASVDGEPESSDLEAGLADFGKADSADSGVTVRNFGLGLRGSAARALYNKMDDSGASASTFNGFRLLRGSATACITNGEATYCELFGQSAASDSADYEALVRGRSAAFVSSLGFDVWFRCEGSGRATTCGVERSEVTTLEFAGMENLGDDFVYEGWAITDAFGAQTTSRFADPSGHIHQRIAKSVVALPITYVLTIEPRRGDDSGPAATHIVAGALENGVLTSLTTEHPAALGTDFGDASGAFLLATPTSPATDDDNQGIWFLDPAIGEPSLSLPTLPAGWVYEGWVVGADGPISTGRFTSVTGPDSDAGGPAAGPDAAPPFPGQDFVNPALDLLGTTIVISVEPEPDNAPGPFAIKPLIDVVAEDVAPPAIQSLELTNANRAHGWAILGGTEIARTGEIWTADRAAGVVSVIDVVTTRPIANLVLGNVEPMYVNHSETAGVVFVGDRKNNQVLVVDPKTYALTKTIDVGAGVFHQWTSPSGETLWVNNDIDNTTSVIDVRTGGTLATIPMPSDLAQMAGSPKPHDVFVTESGNAAFVTYVGFDGDRDYVVRFDGNRYNETHRAAVGKDPHVFATPRGESILVASQDTSEVAFFWQSDLSLDTVVSVPGAHGISGTADGRVYVANTPGGGANALFALDAKTATLHNRDGVDAPIGDGNPHNVTVSGDGTTLFVTHSGPNARTVSIYNVSAEAPVPALVDSVSVGRNPFGLGFVPAN